jgi:hydrogenase expression/formation protein HypC
MCLAIPGRIKELDGDGHFALVEVSGVRRRVNVDLLSAEGLEPDDWVLIHVGFAMSKIGAREAEEQMRLLRMLGEADAAFEEVSGYGQAAGGDGGRGLAKEEVSGYGEAVEGDSRDGQAQERVSGYGQAAGGEDET